MVELWATKGALGANSGPRPAPQPLEQPQAPAFAGPPTQFRILQILAPCGVVDSFEVTLVVPKQQLPLL